MKGKVKRRKRGEGDIERRGVKGRGKREKKGRIRGNEENGKKK